MRRLLSACLLVLAALTAASSGAAAQGITADERAQGYALRGDTTLFVFDPALYGVQPERVVVTGAFRAWSADMDDPAWALISLSSAPIWLLPVPNAGFTAVPAASPFKFRVDDAQGSGRWLDPPGNSPNVEAGNHVFLFGVAPPRLQAELRGPRAVWARLTGDGVTRPLSPLSWRLTRADGMAIPIAAVLPNTASEALIVPAESLDVRRVHYLEVTPEGATAPLRAFASFDGIFRTLYSPQMLGAEVEGGCPRCRSYRPATGTTFRLFAPRADSVRLFLYRDRTGDPFATHALAPDADGTWDVHLDDGQHGTWYDYAVYGPDDPGNTFANHTGRHVSDPYARVSDDSWGRSRVWEDDFAPLPPVRGGRPRMEDVIAYEVHVQDFTDLLPVPDNLRGTMPAMAMPGLRNARGEPIGLDHLERLGVNVVHLMPMQEFLHYPDSVWQAAFAGDTLMQRMATADENYDWGYRTTHAFAVEGRFRARGTEPGAERAQFRDLVQAFHERGMAVVVDYVFNHTGENMEGADRTFTFNGIDRHYYYRLDDAGNHIGVFGNEVKSESRPMVQRWLLDQMTHFIQAFGVDGFRIDLAGQTDEQTLAWLQRQLGPEILIYGEPWIASSDPDYEANPDWDWYKDDAPITFFQDDARTAFKGPVSTPANPAVDRGWAGGDGSLRERVELGLTNAWPDEREANRGINYLDIHDNWALADQFARYTSGPQAWDGRAGVDEAAVRIAATLLLTSLGPVVLNGGTEFLRSKGSAPHPSALGGQLVLQTTLAPIYVNGRGDTYNIRTPNRFDWDRVGWTPAEGAPADYAAMLDWWRGLIALRRSPAGAVFRLGGASPEGHYRFFRPSDPRGLGYVVGGRVLVLLNSGDDAITFDAVALPVGRWTLVADGQRIALDGLGSVLSGGRAHTVPVAAQAAMIWVRE